MRYQFVLLIHELWHLGLPLHVAVAQVLVVHHSLISMECENTLVWRNPHQPKKNRLNLLMVQICSKTSWCSCLLLVEQIKLLGPFPKLFEIWVVVQLRLAPGRLQKLGRKPHANPRTAGKVVLLLRFFLHNNKFSLCGFQTISEKSVSNFGLGAEQRGLNSSCPPVGKDKRLESTGFFQVPIPGVRSTASHDGRMLLLYRLWQALWEPVRGSGRLLIQL